MIQTLILTEWHALFIFTKEVGLIQLDHSFESGPVIRHGLLVKSYTALEFCVGQLIYDRALPGVGKVDELGELEPFVPERFGAFVSFVHEI